MKSVLIIKLIFFFTLIFLALSPTGNDSYNKNLYKEPKKPETDSINEVMNKKLDSLMELKNRYMTKANIIEYKLKVKNK